MSSKSIKTTHGNEACVTNDHGSPLVFSFQDDDGYWRHLYLSCDDATKIAKTLNAFVEIQP